MHNLEEIVAKVQHVGSVCIKVIASSHPIRSLFRLHLLECCSRISAQGSTMPASQTCFAVEMPVACGSSQ